MVIVNIEKEKEIWDRIALGNKKRAEELLHEFSTKLQTKGVSVFQSSIYFHHLLILSPVKP